mmetsp:Transcript_140896/g.259489  ORF Transcript_140896/g.259489 Transcript_140896/m.259489 type:complete len:90 (+) Transcript_140896:1698-1967(+)
MQTVNILLSCVIARLPHASSLRRMHGEKNPAEIQRRVAPAGVGNPSKALSRKMLVSNGRTPWLGHDFSTGDAFDKNKRAPAQQSPPMYV